MKLGTYGILVIVASMVILPFVLSDTVKAQVIPDWVKDNASWWADDLISDQEFVKAIGWLIEKGVITI